MIFMSHVVQDCNQMHILVAYLSENLYIYINAPPPIILQSLM